MKPIIFWNSICPSYTIRIQVDSSSSVLLFKCFMYNVIIVFSIPLSDPPVLARSSAGAKAKVVVEEDLSHIEPLVLWEPSEADKAANPNAAPIVVEPFLCKWLRPHQVGA